ncbi:MAG: hypothetical protein H6665_11020 [Ardenticatenaceae bacterium]|nr:hypothetical protein [Ardenticatenaceae bacterium]
MDFGRTVTGRLRFDVDGGRHDSRFYPGERLHEDGRVTSAGIPSFDIKRPSSHPADGRQKPGKRLSGPDFATCRSQYAIQSPIPNL